MLPASPFASLRHRNFRLFFWGQTASMVGAWMRTLAQGWLVLELTDSAFLVGLVTALSSLPVLLFSLPAGVYVDRSDKHRVVMVCQVLMAFVPAILAWRTFTGAITAGEVAVLATLLGIVQAVEIPARQSFIVELVGKEDLTNAIALNSSAYNATRIVGPAMAGVLIARVSLAACFAINALTMALVIIAFLRMRLPPFVRRPAEASAREQLRQGLRFARHHRGVWALILNTAVFGIFGFPFVVLLPVFARDLLRVGSEGLGVMSAAVGVGAVLSAFGVAAFSPVIRRGMLVRWGGPFFGIAVAAFALVHWYPATLLFLALSGFFMVANNAATNTLLQSLVPDELRGRVMSLWTFVFVGFAPIGSLYFGWMGEYVGAAWAVAIGGLLSGVFGVWMWWRYAPEVSQIR